MAGRLLITILIVLGCLSGALASTRFAVLGDYGAATIAEAQVASLIESWQPDFIVTTGDNSYGSNSIDVNIGQYFAPYIGNYVGSYGSGSLLNRFFPCLGNHDYSDGGGFPAYASYFTLPGAGVVTTGSSQNSRYYDFVKGPVQFYALNSIANEPDGTTPTSIQGLWLQAQLAASEVPWKIVYMHYPPYSSSQHGSTQGMQWPFEDWGASVVLTGHDHTYERIRRDDNSDGDSLTYMVTGLGGRSIYTFPSANLVTGSVIRYNGDYGANLVEATDSTLMIKFITVTGVMIDSVFFSRTTSCCSGSTGNLNGIGGTDLSDLSAMVIHFVGDGFSFACQQEADINGSGRADLTDLALLVAYLVGTMPSLPACP